ncbi:MAG: GNAT family N-acetyltransferase [Burkholderiales bacterium]|nr:GNAT family N-acetyltransferase [Burkholderiales bacterium]
MSVIVRNTQVEDIDGIRELQRRIYPTIPPWSREYIERQLNVFPAGQFVAMLDGKIVGSASSLIVMWDDYGLDHDWREVTGGGTFSTHNPAGKTLYGAEVFVDSAVRRRGIGRSLYAARRRLCRNMNLRRIIAAGRLPGFHHHANNMSATTYAMKVIWGDIDDTVLRFQLREGFQFCGVVDNYIPEDVESCGYAALIVWLNPLYRGTATRSPPRT